MSFDERQNYFLQTRAREHTRMPLDVQNVPWEQQIFRSVCASKDERGAGLNNCYYMLHNYENMPIQICWKFYHQKMKKNFR